MDSNIIDLQEISPNNWRAKYQGNYGIYTIKITTDGKQAGRFSCSCPSSYYPCKHISIIKNAIAERIAKKEDNDENNESLNSVSIAKILKNVSPKELYYFIVRQAKYNSDLTNAILLEFVHKIDKEQNPYNAIFKNALGEINVDYDDYYEENFSIDILDQWLDKAHSHVDEKEYQEALLICKAYIEEFAVWLDEEDSNILDYIGEDYLSQPFALLRKIAECPEVNTEELFDYCMAEMKKEKYANIGMLDEFNDVLAYTASSNEESFMRLQDSLLDEIENKSSYGAEKILRRKITFYRENNQPEKAWEIMEDNLQIENFRKQVVERDIAQGDIHKAKQLINDFLAAKEEDDRVYNSWSKYLLEIAQKEEDIPAIRQICFNFIKDSFLEEYYQIYKKTFSSDEWTAAVEELILHYRNNTNNFNHSIADIYAAEQYSGRLMAYIEQYLTIDRLVQYYTAFFNSYPEKTLTLFQNLINSYAARNTGRSCYEHIISLFAKMLQIKNGEKIVLEMVSQYKSLYKNRRAMIEILERFCAENNLKRGANKV
jgi:hypothetical protein